MTAEETGEAQEDKKSSGQKNIFHVKYCYQMKERALYVNCVMEETWLIESRRGTEKRKLFFVCVPLQRRRASSITAEPDLGKIGRAHV